MKGAMDTQARRTSKGSMSIEEGHVMGGGRPTAGGDEPRRKPRSLPPLTQKPRSPVIAASPLDHELGSTRFIGSPPPTALRAHESSAYSGRDDNGNSLQHSRRGSESGLEEEEEEHEQTVYKPANPSLELSQPRITLNTAPRNASPPPAHAFISADRGVRSPVIGSASSLSMRSLAAMARDSLSHSQELAPPPKLVTYRSEGGAEAVQEWVPDETGMGLATPPRKNSAPSIRDLPSPMMGRHGLTRPPPPPLNNRRSRSTVKLSPIHKEA
ncbi:uncharacterized protein LOC135200603 isoform X1 [Macrobrachium nipponense]|uniref:uncharacterized protein LOC135200603 isoform X1 n=2 Tax=Macrobrachium nipponense TaxID=159736 RepID=UPI0030C847A5